MNRDLSNSTLTFPASVNNLLIDSQDGGSWLPPAPRFRNQGLVVERVLRQMPSPLLTKAIPVLSSTTPP
jgi:hypothetical protein